jgi:hypothetical protein
MGAALSLRGSPRTFARDPVLCETTLNTRLFAPSELFFANSFSKLACQAPACGKKRKSSTSTRLSPCKKVGMFTLAGLLSWKEWDNPEQERHLAAQAKTLCPCSVLRHSAILKAPKSHGMKYLAHPLCYEYFTWGYPRKHFIANHLDTPTPGGGGGGTAVRRSASAKASRLNDQPVSCIHKA